MAEKINWNFLAQVVKGPSISGTGSIDAEAYEKIDFTMPANTGTPPTHEVSLSSTGKISLLIIGSPTPDKKITYKGKGTDLALTGDLALDRPHIFMGQIAGSFIGSATVLTFTNGTAAEAEIQILIGRTTA